MKKILPVATLLIFIVPQIAFAAWWNPLSWNIWTAVESIFVGSPQTHFQITTTTQATNLPPGAIPFGDPTTAPPQIGTTSAAKNKQINSPKTTAIIPPVPQTPTTQPQMPTVSAGQLQSAISNFQAQAALSYITTMIPQLMVVAGSEQTEFSDDVQAANEARQSCTQIYQTTMNTLSQESSGVTSGMNLPSLEAQAEQEQQQFQQQQQDAENSALAQENLCLSQFPLDYDNSVLQQVTQAVNQLNVLWQQVQANPASSSDIASMLQTYNSLEPQVMYLNSENPSPVLTATFQSQTPTPTIGDISCNLVGDSYSCVGQNFNTDCSVTGSSINCVGSTAGQNLSCSKNGDSLNCVSY